MSSVIRNGSLWEYSRLCMTSGLLQQRNSRGYSQMRKCVYISTAALCLLGASSSALSQTVTRGVGPADRSHPEYDPYARSVGSFRILPSLKISTDATDNYRASNTNRLGDVYFTFAPAVSFASDWARNKLMGKAYFDQSLHANLTSENRSQYGVSANGELDFSRDTQLGLELSAKHQVESRASLGSFQGTTTPVQYDSFHARLSASHAVNELTVTGSLGIDYNNFYDVKEPTGEIIFQDFRDLQSITVAGSAQYDLRTGIGILVSAQVEQGRAPFGPGSPDFDPSFDVNRDFTAYSALGGLVIELNSVLSGTIQVGYLRYLYQDVSLEDIEGFSYRANVIWNVTPLTSVRLGAARTVEPTSAQASSANTRNELRVAIDHELFRYVLVQADTVYSTFSPNGIGSGGEEFAAGIGARYLIDRRWSINGRLSYSERRSSNSEQEYHATYANLAIKYAF